MVKPDPKHDYYADLEVPPSSDAESIKKQFRLLAKQYHPDRNPGREIEVVPKFQAVQAAHEILCDPDKRAKYDAERAKLNRKNDTDPYTFKRSQTARAPPPAPAFQQPTRSRNSSVDRSQFANGRPQPTSGTAEKFAAFARAAPQQRDRNKFDDHAAKAENLRNFQSMRGQQQQQPPPQQPPRPSPRAPTAPKTANIATSPDYVHSNGPSPGFPGMSRTQSARRTGFSPATPGNDEPAGPPRSAYAYVNGRGKPPPSSSYPYPPPPSATTATSPPSQNARASPNSLRQSRSSGFENVQRPNLARAPSRYATNSGEKTNINGSGIGRSASVRNSPIDRPFGEQGSFGTRSNTDSSFKVPPPRHRSASPGIKPSRNQFSYSASETSSSEEDKLPQSTDRPKAVPRKPRQPQNGQPAPGNDPALTGQFPSTNYTKIIEDNQYQYPPPESRGTPYRRPFEDLGTKDFGAKVDSITEELNNTGIRHVHKDDIGRSNPNNPRTNESSNSSAPHVPFSAADWDGKFSADDIFRPSERDRKSPSKNTRSKPASRSRAQTVGSGGDDTDEEISPTMAGARPSQSASDLGSKPTNFQTGSFSADDWAERQRNQESQTPKAAPQRSSQQFTPLRSTPKPEPTSKDTASQSMPPPKFAPRSTYTNPDAMDIDSNGTPGSMPPPSGNGVGRSFSENATPQQSYFANAHASSSGVNLDDLKNTAPFRPSAEGLNSLSDLHDDLPFQSRAADTVNFSTSSTNLRHLNLPKRPKPVLPPAEADLSQESWSEYSRKMTHYMHDWNIFNSKMIDHFRMRQEQVNLSMYHNWVTAIGDGASADQFDGLDVISPPPSAGSGADGVSKVKAGYATYMQWLEQDEKCRQWWEVAFEEHRKCLEGLGTVRQWVKAIRARELDRGNTGDITT